ncbi:hypothetical protein [Paenibacillus tyrfis]|uniref:Uncharacterized protein n=1 Tax=Paenibacillus tyrfis TaxID=1501230 RepID=A0A081NT04_9BACL|nr:hypothetical protein [Paenibacillus tyrfis]KEQ21577.1 hypothetical protein ET33_35440 [Paenibacillus tyrfis]
MSVSNAKKQAVCEKYRTYLEIIYTFGNKVMLMKQLYEYAKLLGLAKSYSFFYCSIMELVDAEILRKEPFVAYGKTTQLQMLTIRKFGIRFLEGKQDSYSVASVRKSHGNERIMVSIFKNCYILNKVIPRIIKEGKSVTFTEIMDLLNHDYSTILLNKNQGLSFITQIRTDKTLQQFFDTTEVDHDTKRMQEIKKTVAEGLRKGSESSEGKGKGKLCAGSRLSLIDLNNEIYAKVGRDYTKDEKINNYTVDTMLAFNAYIAQIKVVNNKPIIAILIFDIHNKTNIYKIATHIACIYNMFNRYFKCKFLLRVGVISIDEHASKNLESQAKGTYIDFMTKERRGIRLLAILNEWRVDALMQESIKVRFADNNITNEFMDAIKHANLVRR